MRAADILLVQAGLETRAALAAVHEATRLKFVADAVAGLIPGREGEHSAVRDLMRQRRIEKLTLEAGERLDRAGAMMMGAEALMLLAVEK